MKKELLKIILSAIIFVLAIAVPFTNVWITRGLFFISYIIVGFEIIKKAFKNIKKGRPFDENFLMTVATVGAFCIGEFPEAVAVMLFYQIGELFQDYAVDKSRKSIVSLMDIRPDFANVIKRSKTTVLSRFNGKSEFTRDELEKILQYYNLSEDRFITIFLNRKVL